jgi:outer membrane protein
LLLCNKTAEVKEVKTVYVDTSVLMKEYTEGKILKQNIKHSLKKGRQLDAEIKRFKTLLIFKVKRKQTVRLGHNKRS